MKKLILLVFLFASSSNPVISQTWLQQTSPVTTDLNGAWAFGNSCCWMCGPNGVVIRTDNGGNNWSLVNSGLGSRNFYCISSIDSIICVVGADDGTLWRTSNRGANWANIPLSPTNPFLDVVHFFNANYGFAMGDPSGGYWRYYITTNGGLNWTAGPVAIPAIGAEAGWNNGYCALDTSFILIGTNTNRILKGSFKGSWTSGTIPGTNSAVFTFNNTLNGAAYFGSGQIMYTTNGGGNWINSGFTPGGNVYAISGVKFSQLMFLGTSTNIYGSLNNGANWYSQFVLPSGSTVYTITCTSSFGLTYTCWAGTMGGKIFKYYSYLGVNQSNSNIPEEYSLLQNYPNPFNPVTTIKYSIPVKSFVTLNVYDALGNKIKTVVSGNEAAGNYVEKVDMTSFASGIYFYTLKAGNYAETKKMTLVK